MSINFGTSYLTSNFPKQSKIENSEDPVEVSVDDRDNTVANSRSSSTQKLAHIDAMARSRFTAESMHGREVPSNGEHSEVTLGNLDLKSSLVKIGAFQPGSHVEAKFFDSSGEQLKGLRLTAGNKVKYDGDPADLDGKKISVQATVVDPQGKKQTYHFAVSFGQLPVFRHFYSTFSSAVLDLVPENLSELDRSRFKPVPLGDLVERPDTFLVNK